MVRPPQPSVHVWRVRLRSGRPPHPRLARVRKSREAGQGKADSQRRNSAHRPPQQMRRTWLRIPAYLALQSRIRCPTDLTLNREIRSKCLVKDIRGRRQMAQAAHCLGPKNKNTAGGGIPGATDPVLVSLHRPVMWRARPREGLRPHFPLRESVTHGVGSVGQRIERRPLGIAPPSPSIENDGRQVVRRSISPTHSGRSSSSGFPATLGRARLHEDLRAFSHCDRPSKCARHRPDGVVMTDDLSRSQVRPVWKRVSIFRNRYFVPARERAANRRVDAEFRVASGDYQLAVGRPT